MFFKGIIFDLDDTLYNYKICNEKAYKEVDIYLQNKYKINFFKDLEKVKNLLKKELNNTASSHNRFIYFKKIMEINNLPYYEVIKSNGIYWDTFYSEMKLFDGLLEIFKNLKRWNKKIIILTDFQTEYQFKKLEKLNILNDIDYIITSEEVGIEKPSFKMFDTVINTSKIKKEELIMVGDNYEKDILGAQDYGIYSFHFKNNFDKFNKFLINLNKDINDFVKLCNDCGNDFNLVQLGGGNISIKNNDLMIIKSSGITMKNININNGYSIINNKKLFNDLVNNNLNCLENYLLFNRNKSSIETYMHSLLKKYTVHLHPIDINKILVRKNAKELINNLYPQALILEYIRPGLEIAKQLLKENLKDTNTIFLLNHGVIYTSDSLEEIYNLINFNNENYISQDIYLNKNIELVKNYYDKYCFPDAVIYLKNNYYIKDNKIYLKDKKYEEILKAHTMILEEGKEINFLDEEEINNLINRDDEKYRKNVN